MPDVRYRVRQESSLFDTGLPHTVPEGVKGAWSRWLGPVTLINLTEFMNCPSLPPKSTLWMALRWVSSCELGLLSVWGHMSKLAKLGTEDGPWRACEANEHQLGPSGGGLLPVPTRKLCVPLNCFVCGQSSWMRTALPIPSGRITLCILLASYINKLLLKKTTKKKTWTISAIGFFSGNHLLWLVLVFLKRILTHSYKEFDFLQNFPVILQCSLANTVFFKKQKETYCLVLTLATH